MVKRFPQLATEVDIPKAVLNLDVMPSMRLLMTAGEAVDRDNTCAYNCSYLAMDSIRSFRDQMFILMNGTGVGYGVEHRDVSKIPYHPKPIKSKSLTSIVVEDSKEGWSNAYETVLNTLVSGLHPSWDMSNVRPAGARLKTFGGRASGPGPLNDVFHFACHTLSTGLQPRPIDVLDINNVSARSIIVGGVRRSAQISLSDLSDRDIALSKSGAWWEQHNYRSLSNNSAVYEERPLMGQFLEEWSSLYNSHSGERGIFNRGAARLRCKELGRDPDVNYGTNPCGEILLRPNQFCNLSEVIIRPNDTLETLANKVRIATILGTCQSALTHFPYLGRSWVENCEEERLLGVSFTGIYDNPLMYLTKGLANRLETLREVARTINATWADRIGINKSKAITCVKPSGTVSCLANCASGIHPRYAKFYIRRVRMDIKEPLCQLMMDQGVPHEPCVMNPQSTMVFSFPMAAPKNGLVQKDVSALEHLALWRIYKRHWCDHNPSITVSYSEDEFLEVGSWVWKNFDEVQGISFLPRSGHVYAQAPFEEISEEQYHQTKNPTIDYSLLPTYEKSDTTTASHTMACTGGACELVDLTGQTN